MIAMLMQLEISELQRGSQDQVRAEGNVDRKLLLDNS